MNRKLLNILKYTRPAGSNSELMMIREFIDPLPNVYADAFGNRIVQIGDAPSTMFSCHTDTVHHTGGIQRVFHDKDKDEIFVTHDECLGADDGAGIMILIEMIEAQVEGLYIFHREEEIGGQGSSYIADKTPELLNGIEKCIAFDRKGTTSVITHQGMERCCSDDFADSLVDALSTDDDFFMTDDTGSFTDSANYTHLIPECTNVSCGYSNEHTKMEVLNVGFLDRLINSVLNIDWAGLVVKRDPDVIEYSDFNYSSYYDNYKDADLLDMSTYEDVLDFVYESPEQAATMLMEYKEDLMDQYVYDNNKEYLDA